MTTAVRRLGLIAAVFLAAVLIAGEIAKAERGRGAAESAAKVMAQAALVAQRAAADSGRMFRAARLRADSAEARFLHADRGETAATATTDTARDRLAAERDRAVAMAKDSAATAAQLRGELAALAARSDSAIAAFTAERDTLHQRIALAMTAIGEKDSALVLAAGTIRTDSTALHDVEQELADVKAAQPGVIARAVHGVATFAIAAGCAGATYAALLTPAGPVIAVAAAAAGGGICAAVWGAVGK